MNIHFSSQSPEWYTPVHIIDRSLLALGAIDLDPCSNSHETPNVPAALHFTQEEDGLKHEWYGRVYMNPPYGREVSKWVAHLLNEYRAGRVREAIGLLPARTDTQWFRLLRSFPRCFLYGRLKFSGHSNSAPFPSVLVYMGDNPAAFVDAFGDIGDVYLLLEKAS